MDGSGTWGHAYISTTVNGVTTYYGLWPADASNPGVINPSEGIIRGNNPSSNPYYDPTLPISNPNGNQTYPGDTLLTGLLKCGVCGNGLTLATGKGGKYKYYKCTNRTNHGNYACSSKNYRMEVLDNTILTLLAEQVLTDENIQGILSELRGSAKSAKDEQQARINTLMKQMKQLEARRTNLIDAIETGVIDHDLIQDRAQKIKSSIESLHIEIAGARRLTTLPLDYLKPSSIETVAKVIRSRICAADSSLAKGYLNMLVDEIRVEHEKIEAKGSHLALAETLTKIGQGAQVPTIVCEWRARRESNPRPSA
jgi:site-specific DNA recombinase